MIPHGAFTHLAKLDPALPPELPAKNGPVAVLPGLIRPYKGLDLLLEAWQSYGAAVPGQLWIVGRARMPLPTSLPAGVTVVNRFVSEAELAGVLDAADLVVLPYREIDQSGIVYASLGMGRPMLLSDVGGFPEVAATGAAELFPAGDAAALAVELQRLLQDADRRTVMGENSRDAAAGVYSWQGIAAAHMDMYRNL
jgi:glycosyltransferase involved in cell wall biosynthesis